MTRVQGNVRRPAVDSAFAELKEGEVVFFEFENETRESQIRRGNQIFGQCVMPYLFDDDDSGRTRVSLTNGLVDLLNEALRLVGFELRFHEAYNEDDALNATVTNIEKGAPLTAKGECEYDNVTSVQYKIHHI